MLKGINEFYTNNEAYNRINRLDGYFAIRENQLGWLNSLLTPSSAILAEIITFEDYRINKNDMETSTKQNIENNKIAQKQKDVDVTDVEESINEGAISFVAGRLVWLMLPGAQQVKEFVATLYDYAVLLINLILAKFIGVWAMATGGLMSLAKTPLVYLFTSYIIETTFQKVPLLVCTTASVIAFVSYLVSLCKYFYISPFVVAFSMATKRMNKIVDFLVSGISIFFKPILIVLFILLCLFIH